MSKKHFEALAAALRYVQPGQSGIEQWAQDCRVIAGVCARFNPNFDRERFLKACGMEEAN